MAATETRISRIDAPPASDLERALLTAASQLRRERYGILGAQPKLEDLADQLIEKVLRDEHTFVLCSAKDPADPTTEEHRWAQSIASTVARRFQRTARRVLRSLKSEAPAPAVDDSRDLKGCPAWCVHHGTSIDCDWHESKPIAFHGPGDFYTEDPEPVEVLWAVISETPKDAVEDGQDPGTYIFLDTLGDGMGARLDVAGADRVIRDLSRHVMRLKAMRDQLAALQTPEA